MKSREESQDPALKDILYGLNHNLFEDDLGRSLLSAWSLGAADGTVRELIRGRVENRALQEALGNTVPFRRPRLSRGEILLGHAEGREVRVPLQTFASGFLLASQTGGGKTTFILFLVVQLIVAGARVWICDMYKSQLRHLHFALERLGLPLVVLRHSDWKINHLQANGIHPRTHLAIVIDLLARTLHVPPRARTILNHGCQELYSRFGIWDGQTNEWPCLFDLYEWVRTTKGLNPAAREALLDRLAGLLSSLTPEVAAYRRGWSYVDLAKYSIVFEMAGAPESIKQLLLEPAVYTLMQHQIESGVPNAPLSTVTILEDSQRFLNDDQGASGAIAPLDELAGVVRGAGLGLGVLVQSVYGVSKRLLPNLSLKLCGRLGSMDDSRAMAGHLGLTSEQSQWIRTNLKTGMFCGQVATSDWREPFVFQAPFVRIPPRVDTADVLRSQQPLASLPTIRAQEYASWTHRPAMSVSTRDKEPVSKRAVAADGLSEAEQRYLRAVVESPGKPSSTYSRLAKLNGQRAVDVRKVLVEKGFLREHVVATGRRGRSAIVLEPLEAAYRILGEDLP